MENKRQSCPAVFCVFTSFLFHEDPVENGGILFLNHFYLLLVYVSVHIRHISIFTFSRSIIRHIDCVHELAYRCFHSKYKRGGRSESEKSRQAGEPFRKEGLK